MQDFIIIGIIAAALGVGIFSAVRHFKGKGGCCGSKGSYTPKKKKLKNIIAVKIFCVQGMYCEHCRNRVIEAINDIPHVAGTVDLKIGQARVEYETMVDDTVVKAKIERAGYTVTEIKA